MVMHGAEGGGVEPTQIDAQHRKCAVCALSVEGSERQRWVVRERERTHPDQYPVRNVFVFYATGEVAVEGSVCWIKRCRARLGRSKA